MSSARPSGHRALVVGAGYLGARVALRLGDLGLRVAATSRSPDRLRELRSESIEGWRLDLSDPDDFAAEWLRCRWDTIVWSVAPGRGGDARLAYRDGLLTLLEHVGPRAPGCVVLVSTTGVHAQRDGSWVTEESPAESEEPSHRWILSAESELLAGAGSADRAAVVRLGGLYGPGRSPLEWVARDAFRERVARSDGDAYMNWIRVEDAADVVAAAAREPAAEGIYLAVDGSPVRRRDFWGEAARLAGAPPPVFEGTGDLGKRCSPRRAIQELAFRPRFPDHRSGLGDLAPRPTQGGSAPAPG